MFRAVNITIRSATDLPPGTMRTVHVDHREVLIVSLCDGYHAVDDTCTHDLCSLGEGWLEDGIVECPCHGATFDVRTGAALTLPATEPLRVYPVQVMPDGDLQIELPD